MGLAAGGACPSCHAFECEFLSKCVPVQSLLPQGTSRLLRTQRIRRVGPRSCRGQDAVESRCAKSCIRASDARNVAFSKGPSLDTSSPAAAIPGRGLLRRR